jgi:hypothetical protein
VDPRKPQWDLVFALPDWAGPGPHELQIAVGKRNYPVVQLQVEDGGAAAPY